MRKKANGAARGEHGGRFMAAKWLTSGQKPLKTKPAQKRNAPLSWDFSGGPCRTRTDNQRIMSPLLHH